MRQPREFSDERTDQKRRRAESVPEGSERGRPCQLVHHGSAGPHVVLLWLCVKNALSANRPNFERSAFQEQSAWHGLSIYLFR